MQYVVVLKRNAEKVYASLPEKDQKRVLVILQGLRDDPWIGKKLQGPLKGLYSVRVWPYRIIYEIVKSTVTVTVVAIGDRKDVYRF